MATLPAGINPLLSPKPKKRTLRTASRGFRYPSPPGDIIPEWGARIDRNAGRQLIGTGGRHHSGIGGRLAPASAPGATRRLMSARCKDMASALAAGRTRAAVARRRGQTAPKM